MFSTILAFAQGRVVTGEVRDNKGDPAAFATITETGTRNAVQANASGVFSIRIKEGSQLTITSSGFETRTYTPTNSGSQIVTMESKSGELREVVVTSAFGIKRTQRTTPYSAQVLGNEQLNIIPQTNLNSMLAGKVVGTQFRMQSPIKLNSEGSLRIRGGLTLADKGPIYVVDGTAVGSFDLNPDDVEDVTILKGANATALFGDAAVGGAIVITTRKKPKNGTMGIEVRQGLTFDKVYILPDYQDQYAGGSAPDLMKFTFKAGMPAEWQKLDGKYFHDYTDDASWGPRMVGQEYVPWYSWIPGHSLSGTTEKLSPQPDNARDFWNTGINSSTNISFAKMGQGFTTRLSYTNNYIKGMLPKSSAEKHNLNGSISMILNEHFTAAANINFSNNKIRGVFDDGYANQSQGSFNQWFHRNLDMNKMKDLRGLKTPIGTYASWNLTSNPDAGNAPNVYRGNYWYNFFTWFDNINNRTIRDRLFGDVSLTYALNKNISIKGIVRKNELNTYYENIKPSILETSATQTGELASYSTGQTRLDEMNYQMIGTYNNTFFDKLEVTVNAGGTWLRYNYKDVTQNTVNGLNVPDLYAISNSKSQANTGNTRLLRQTRSAFASGDIEFNKLVNLNFAIRNDYHSTLPAGNNLVSPSVGLSFFFGELVKETVPWLTYGKIFGSWGKKPTPLDIFATNFLYGVNQNQWNGNFLMSTPDAGVMEGVKGNTFSTMEFGIDMRFLKNRLGLNVVYFDETNKDEPLRVETPRAGGFSSLLQNALNISRKGIEVQITATPVRRKNFSWDIINNFAYLIDNKVSDFPAGNDRILLAGGAFGTRFARVFQEKDMQWGQLIGGGISRNEAGKPLLDASGLFVADADKHWGSVVPKTTGGIINNFTYKDFSVNFNLDYQVGGKFFSLSEQWGHYSGLLAATAYNNDKGKNIRDAIPDGGGVHVSGVQAADGKTPVDMYIDAQTYFHQFYNNRIAEPYIHSLTFVKLREVAIGYQIPVQKLKIDRTFKSIQFSLVSRNPLLIYRETKSFDPSEISAVQGEDGQYPGTRSLGFNLKFNF
jgi:TonB-linked SusC/RagA family outer membrane protein